MVQVLFATEASPPYDGLCWWVSEKQLVEVMGRRPSGQIDLEVGKKIVTAMIEEYNALTGSTPDAGIVIK